MHLQFPSAVGARLKEIEVSPVCFSRLEMSHWARSAPVFHEVLRHRDVVGLGPQAQRKIKAVISPQPV